MFYALQVSVFITYLLALNLVSHCNYLMTATYTVTRLVRPMYCAAYVVDISNMHWQCHYVYNWQCVCNNITKYFMPRLRFIFNVWLCAYYKFSHNIIIIMTIIMSNSDKGQAIMQLFYHWLQSSWQTTQEEKSRIMHKEQYM